jgi:hypothetical protein
VGPLLIGPHQPRVPCRVGGENRSEAADRGHGSAVKVHLTKSTLKPAAALAPEIRARD